MPPMTAGQRTDVDIQVASDAKSIPDDTTIRDWVVTAVAAGGGSSKSTLEVSVRVVDEAEMQALNFEYRNRDASTNVLSFPAEPIDALPADVPASLGDIVVCAPVVERQAREQGKSIDAHWGHMLVHGTLHLLGFDHIIPSDAAAMEALELRILSQRGIADPYTLEPVSK